MDEMNEQVKDLRLDMGDGAGAMELAPIAIELDVAKEKCHGGPSEQSDFLRKISSVSSGHRGSAAAL